MDLNKNLALQALQLLDQKLSVQNFSPFTLTVGGGGALLIEYNYPGSTVDIDAVPSTIEFEQIKPFMEEVSRELHIAPDWLNPYYQSFTVYLPRDAKDRMHTSFQGKVITVKTLGAEEILLMKLMAARAKDLGHIKHLLKLKPNLQIINDRLDELQKMFPKESSRAQDLLDELTDEMDL